MLISAQQAVFQFQAETAAQASALCQQQQTQQAQVQAAQRYKTELCRSFQENGTCKYGEKCQFAHGHHELRSMMRHPKYKSELCRTFHAQGYCPYGPRCHFVHEIKPEYSNNKSASNPALQDMTANRWINTKASNAWTSCHYNSAPGSKSVSPKSDDSGLLMCALSGSSSSLFSCNDTNFNVWDIQGDNQTTSGRTSSSSSSSRSSTHEIISPTSSRSLSPANNERVPDATATTNLFYENDLDFSTTMLVNNIINTINNDYQFIN